MDTIITAKGTQISTDYFSAIPTPKVMFFRCLDLPFVDVLQIMMNSEESASIQYGNYVFYNCQFTSIQNEFGVPKVSMTYERMEIVSNENLQDTGESSPDDVEHA